MIILLFRYKYYLLSSQKNFYQEIYYNNIDKVITGLIGDKAIKKNATNLIIIFSPEDCDVCLDEITSLWGLTNRISKIGFFGIINHPYPELAYTYINNRKWNFPCRIINNNLYNEGLGLGKTPIKIFLQNGKILYVEGPRSNWRIKSGIIKYLNNL